MRKILVVTTLLLTAVIISALLLYGLRAEIYTGLQNWKLLPTNQEFTELYFNDYLALPKTVTAGQSISFSFTIHNVEGVTTAYPYTVYFLYPDGQKVPFVTDSVTLANNASTSINVSYQFHTSDTTGSVVVDLTQLNQTIDFLI
jgi:hypothetical protein